MFLEPQLSPINRYSNSFQKKKKMMEKIQQDSNEKLQKMTENIFSNNDSLKRNYEKFMNYQHNLFVNVRTKFNFNHRLKFNLNKITN